MTIDGTASVHNPTKLDFKTKLTLGDGHEDDLRVLSGPEDGSEVGRLGRERLRGARREVEVKIGGQPASERKMSTWQAQTAYLGHVREVHLQASKSRTSRSIRVSDTSSAHGTEGEMDATDHLVLRRLLHGAGERGDLGDSHDGKSSGEGTGEGRGEGLACEGAEHVVVGG